MSQPPGEKAAGVAIEGDAGAAHELKTQLHKALKGLRFGQLVVFVQDGHVTRIEMNEKVRLFRSR
jgi:hypothetical protein